jgi:hypothetical protein
MRRFAVRRCTCRCRRASWRRFAPTPSSSLCPSRFEVVNMIAVTQYIVLPRDILVSLLPSQLSTCFFLSLASGCLFFIFTRILSLFSLPPLPPSPFPFPLLRWRCCPLVVPRPPVLRQACTRCRRLTQTRRPSACGPRLCARLRVRHRLRDISVASNYSDSHIEHSFVLERMPRNNRL